MKRYFAFYGDKLNQTLIGNFSKKEDAIKLIESHNPDWNIQSAHVLDTKEGEAIWERGMIEEN